MTTNVLITTPFQKEWGERLQQLAPDVRVTLHPISGRERIPDEAWRDTEVAYTFGNQLPSREQAPHLRWVQLYSAGSEFVQRSPLFHTDVRFTTMSGIHAVPISEYVLAVILAWYHRLPLLFDWQRQQYWPTNRWPRREEDEPELLPEEVRGKIIGIVGYGSIGREVARLTTTLGMRVLAMQRGNDHRDTGFVFPGIGDPNGTLPERFYPPEQLHAMLADCDVVMIGVPLTAQTRHMFNEAALKAMKSSAFLINIARGDICDEDALTRALTEQWIAGAALDVFHKEPLPTDSPLWKLPNIMISPHITGLSTHYDERAAQVFEENLRRYLHNEPLYNEVDKERGY